MIHMSNVGWNQFEFSTLKSSFSKRFLNSGKILIPPLLVI